MPIGRIQREARGLLPFLDIVGQQMRPVAIDEIVHGTVDLTPFYGAPQLRSIGVITAGALQNRADELVFEIPAGTAFLMIGGQAGMGGLAVGEQASISYRIRTPDAVASRLATRELCPAAPAGGLDLWCCPVLTAPILLQPGNAITVIVEASTAAVAKTGLVFATGYQFAL